MLDEELDGSDSSLAMLTIPLELKSEESSIGFADLDDLMRWSSFFTLTVRLL